MQISSRFTIAVHMLAYISMYGEKEKVTSEILSGSIQVNPVIIRRLLSRMKTAGLITVAGERRSFACEKGRRNHIP